MSLTGKIFGSMFREKATPSSVIARSASAALLTAVLGLTACTRDYTVAYVYATSSNGINEYDSYYQSGSLVPIPGSPVAAGNTPIAIIRAPGDQFVYVLNQGDSTVQQFAIGSDGKLTSKNTYKTGTRPTALAIDAAGKFLYVTYTYQAGYSATNPGPGGITIFPVSSDNSLGTSINYNVGNNPVGVALSAFNNYAYVIDAEPAVGSISPNGQLLAFSRDLTSGALTPIGKTVISKDASGRSTAVGYGAGTVPSSIAEDPTSRFVYVTDKATNQLYGNVVLAGGILQAMQNSPFATGLLPVAVTVDPRGKFLYVSNFNDNTVSAFAIDLPTGAPVGSVGSASTKVGTGPSCVAIEPALGIYLYTSNNLDNTTTGLQLDPHNGSLKNIQNTPFPATGTPSCITAVANGSHATQVVNP